MSDTFLENHLRSLYRFLGHTNYYSRCGSFDYSSNRYDNIILRNEHEVIEYAKKYNGQRNIFISRAARNQDGSIHHCNVVSFDIDPIRPKGEAATNEQHLSALSAGKRILERYGPGYLSSSGNGCLLLFHVPNGIPDLELHYRKEKVLIKELQELVNDLGVRIDGTYYDQAVIKAIGTYSTKGEHNLRRCSRFIQGPVPPYGNSQKLLQRLSEIKPEESLADRPIDVNSLKSKFDGDRSTADFHLANYLHKSGVGPSTALALLQANPLGRQTDEKDQARIIGKLWKDVQLPNAATKSYFTRLFDKDSESESAIRTGFHSLDAVLGPLPKGEIVTIAARSGFGKSTFGCTITEDLRRSNKKVLYFSTEIHKDYIMHKLLAIAKDIPIKSLVEKQDLEQYRDRINEYEQELLRTPITICDEFQPTLELVRQKVLECSPDLIVFDHINQTGTHWEMVAQFMRGLKELVSQEQCTAIVLAQLNEPPRGSNGEEGKSIRGDIRGSQEILFLSAIFIYFSNPYEVKGRFQPVEAHIAKNRYGISGQEVGLSVDKEISKFIERKPEHESSMS